MPFELWRLTEARDWPSRPGPITHSSIQWHGPRHSRYAGYWTAEINGTYRGSDERFWISRVRYDLTGECGRWNWFLAF